MRGCTGSPALVRTATSAGDGSVLANGRLRLATNRGHQSATAGGAFGRHVRATHPPQPHATGQKRPGVCGAGRCRSARVSGTGGVVAERQAAAARDGKGSPAGPCARRRWTGLSET
jgi:hypothetical protein